MITWRHSPESATRSSQWQAGGQCLWRGPWATLGGEGTDEGGGRGSMQMLHSSRSSWQCWIMSQELKETNDPELLMMQALQDIHFHSAAYMAFHPACTGPSVHDRTVAFSSQEVPGHHTTCTWPRTCVPEVLLWQLMWPRGVPSLHIGPRFYPHL